MIKKSSYIKTNLWLIKQHSKIISLITTTATATTTKHQFGLMLQMRQNLHIKNKKNKKIKATTLLKQQFQKKTTNRSSRKLSEIFTNKSINRSQFAQLSNKLCFKISIRKIKTDGTV